MLLYRRGAGGLEVLLVHPGGPLWRRKHVGAWQIPKGEIEAGEDEQAAARREVAEELGIAIAGPLLPLGEVRQAGGKRVIAFAVESDFDPSTLVSNMAEIEWPPRSGQRIVIPEIDEAQWLKLDAAAELMLPSQRPFLDRLAEALSRRELVEQLSDCHPRGTTWRNGMNVALAGCIRSPGARPYVGHEGVAVGQDVSAGVNPDLPLICDEAGGMEARRCQAAGEPDG